MGDLVLVGTHWLTGVLGTISQRWAIGRLVSTPFCKYGSVCCRDVSERKREKESLRASEERCRQLVEEIDDIAYMIDA